MSEPLSSTNDLKLGDVVQYSLQLRSRDTGETFWFTRFGAVVKLTSIRRLAVWTLVPHPNIDFEPRELDLRDEKTVVVRVAEDKWPQGVIAMRMKWIAKGVVPVDGSGLT